MMLKVVRDGEAYKVSEVTDEDKIQSVINGDTDPDDAAIYLLHQDDKVAFSDLGSDTIDSILDYLESEGLLGILDDIYDDEAKTEDYVFPLDGEDRGSNVTSFDDHYPNAETQEAIEESRAMSNGFAEAVKDAELSKEDKIEILRAAGADLIEAILEVRAEARLMAETLDEILDSSDRNARNAMARLLEAVGADFAPAESEDDDAEVIFGFQQLQVDRVTEAVMWAAASIVENA